MHEIVAKITDIVYQTKKETPLVHCLTNPLTANDCANIILTVGAKPIMAQHLQEIAQITKKSKALVINIGGITDDMIESVFLSGHIAKAHNIPIIFDPVGAAGSDLRKTLSKRILTELSPDIIKGNMSEIKALCDLETDAVGVDVAAGDIITDKNEQYLAEIVKALAVKQNAVIVATGKTDIIANQDAIFLIKNGVSMMSQVTGTGCMCTSLIGAYCNTGDYLSAAIAAVTIMGISGELAQLSCKGIGGFKTLLFDNLYTISDETIKERSKIIAYH
ncbi:hydroxyethylthiazole kinase [Cellulosilyticum sp. I15G10I2]|uniref:hydroxyethylthiazole kinase n=1 Tax=Cellulosilyticum sp. I15G10I2 TaxID=1892843 RepID=UPI00085C02E7|nr:hydroxyethylthiazole kinase [Cellulosilyticum sp. I15G10I2]